MHRLEPSCKKCHPTVLVKLLKVAKSRESCHKCCGTLGGGSCSLSGCVVLTLELFLNLPSNQRFSQWTPTPLQLPIKENSCKPSVRSFCGIVERNPKKSGGFLLVKRTTKTRPGLSLDATWRDAATWQPPFDG